MTTPGQRRFLILHGWQHHRPAGHWLYWLAEQLRRRGEPVAYPQLPRPDAPDLAEWREVLRTDLAMLGAGPRVVICHSLGCLLWLHHAMAMDPAEQVDRVLLVAPPGPGLFVVPEVASFAPAAWDRQRLARSSRAPIRLVCSDDDPYCPEGAATVYGEPLGLDVDLLPGTQHLTPDSGHGPWPDALAWALDPAHRFRVAGSVAG